MYQRDIAISSSPAGAGEPAPDRYRGVIFTAAPVVRKKTSAVLKRRLTTPEPLAGRAGGRQDPPLSAAFTAFLERVFERAALPLPAYRLAPLGRRVPACVRALRCRSVEAALATIESHPASLQIALNAILVGVTSFFRDPEVFDHLRQTALPRIIGRQGPIRVWSAACSDGAELYSIAMMLHRAGALGGAELLGTDCRPIAVEAAERGLFTHESLEDVDASIRRDYFEPHGAACRIRADIRASTRWHASDLLNEMPRGPMQWDMILCRNLAIYLDSSACARLWQALAGSLRPGGMLVVGKAERPIIRGLARIGPCCYEKQ